MPVVDLDPRRVPYRDDIAADWLQNSVQAQQFVAGIPYQVRLCYTALRQAADPKSRQTSMLLFGEEFVVYQERDGWAWGQNQIDGYVGFVKAEALRGEVYCSSHRVCALRTYVYERADLKSPVRGVVSLNSPVQVIAQRQKFAAVRGAGWVFAPHLVEVGVFAKDYVELAERLVGTPYLWGGRTTIGLDCSGLVQLVLEACGYRAPRDSDMQAREIGQQVPAIDGTYALQRGDIMFFPGHVGIMVDEERLINATAFTMEVSIEPWQAVAHRARADDGTTITAVRRLVMPTHGAHE